MAFKRKFNDEDKVVIKKDGRIGVISGFYSGIKKYKVELDDNIEYYGAEKLDHYKESSKEEFKLGDRVVVEGALTDVSLANKHFTGTIIKNTSDLYGDRLAIRFDERVGGHSCNRECEHGYGFWIEKKAVSHLVPEIKVGDRVKVNHELSNILSDGDCNIGTVLKINDSHFHNWTAIEFDEYVGGHTCCRLGKNGYCLWVEPKSVELVTSSKDTIPELKTGMRAKLRNGEICVIIYDEDEKLFKFCANSACYRDYDSELKSESASFQDVIELYSKCIHSTLNMYSLTNAKLLWKRKDIKTITKSEAESELSKKYGCEVRIDD